MDHAIRKMNREHYHQMLDQAMNETREGDAFLPQFVRLVLLEATGIEPINDPDWVHPEGCGYTSTGNPHNCFCSRHNEKCPSTGETEKLLK